MNRSIVRKISTSFALRQFGNFISVQVFLAMALSIGLGGMFGSIESGVWLWSGVFFETQGNATRLINLLGVRIHFPVNTDIWLTALAILIAVGVVQLSLLVRGIVHEVRSIRWHLKELERIEQTALSLVPPKPARLESQAQGREKSPPSQGPEMRSLHRQLETAVAAYNSQVRFVSDASHELRTPIAVIDGYANMLDRWAKQDPAILDEAIFAIKNETTGMKSLIEQLLFLARGDSESIQPNKEMFDLSALARQAVDEFTMIDSQHVFQSRGEGVMACLDRSLIKQTLRIFLDNAVKYSDVGETIVVQTALRRGEVTISVTDNGFGIESDMLEHVFDRFTRADASRTRATGGAGLGLAIAYWIVQRHNGHIEVLSRPGIGSRFTMVFPGT